MHRVQCLWRPEEGVRCPELELEVGCELPSMGAGTKPLAPARSVFTINH